MLCFKDADQQSPDAKGDFDLSTHAHLEVMPADQKRRNSISGSAVSQWRFALTTSEHNDGMILLLFNFAYL